MSALPAGVSFPIPIPIPRYTYLPVHTNTCYENSDSHAGSHDHKVPETRDRCVLGGSYMTRERKSIQYHNLIPSFRRAGGASAETIVKAQVKYRHTSSSTYTTESGPDIKTRKMLRRLAHKCGATVICDEEAKGRTGYHRVKTVNVRILVKRWEMIAGAMMLGCLWILDRRETA